MQATRRGRPSTSRPFGARGGPALRLRRRARNTRRRAARGSRYRTRTAGRCATAPRWPASARWPSRRPGQRVDLPARDGHLQATGRDARGRKQYRYHAALARACATRPSTTAWSPSAQALPAHPRARVDARPGAAGPAAREGAGRRSCGCWRRTLIRVGNEEYARAQRLLRPDHAARPPRRRSTARGCASSSAARAASAHAIELARPPPGAHRQGAAATCPASELFQYLDEDGERRSDRLRRRQRLPARDRRRGLHRQGLPHLGRHRARPPWRCARPAACDVEAPRRSATSTRAIEAVARAARQHAGGLPQVLHPPGRGGRLPRGQAAGRGRRRGGRDRPADKAATSLAALLKRSISSSRPSRRRSGAPFSGAPRSRARISPPPP